MYKPLWLALLICGSLWGRQAELTDLQYAALLRYDGRMGLQVGKRQKMRSFAEISPSKAEEIAEKVCMKGEEIDSIRLMRERKLLYYRLGSKDKIAKINALDGALIQCRRRER
ncbi:hypothetical protein [Hydrogenimonas sp.]